MNKITRTFVHQAISRIHREVNTETKRIVRIRVCRQVEVVIGDDSDGVNGICMGIRYRSMSKLKYGKGWKK